MAQTGRKRGSTARVMAEAARRGTSILDDAIDATQGRDALRAAVRRTRVNPHGFSAALLDAVTRYETREAVRHIPRHPPPWQMNRQQRRSMKRLLGLGWRSGVAWSGVNPFEVIDLTGLNAAPLVGDPPRVNNPLLKYVGTCPAYSNYWDGPYYALTGTTVNCLVMQAGKYGVKELELPSVPRKVHESYWRWWSGGPQRWASRHQWIWPGSARAEERHLHVVLAPGPGTARQDLPLAVGRPEPAPVSWSRAAGRVTDPLAAGNEGYQAGYGVDAYPQPARAGEGAQFEFAVNAKGETLPVTKPQREKPHEYNPSKEPKTERKTQILAMNPQSLAVRVIGFVGEAGDFLEALYQALPEEYKAKGHYFSAEGRYVPPSFLDRMSALYRHWDKVELDTALKNVVLNQLQDAVFGRVGSKIADNWAAAGYSNHGLLLGPWDGGGFGVESPVDLGSEWIRDTMWVKT